MLTMRGMELFCLNRTKDGAPGHPLYVKGVYDFREPVPGVRGFAWSDVDPEWKAWVTA